jgi:hypothetical protein
MHIDLRPFLYLWIALDAVIIVLFGWRQSIARKEDASIDVLHSGSPLEATLNQKLEQIDKWVKLLTVIAVVYGVILGALYIYQGIVSPAPPGA